MVKRIGLAILCLVFLISCKSEQPKFVGIENVIVEGLKDSLMLINMDYVVYNPNSVKTRLKESTMNIYYKNEVVGKGYLDKEINLKPRDTIQIPVQCEVGLRQLHKFYPELLASNTSKFMVKGESQVGFLLNSFAIGISDTIILNTGELIKEEINKNLGKTDNFKINSVAVNVLPSLNKTRFVLEVETKNNLPLEYKIEQMNLKFYASKNDEAIAQWILDRPVLQKAYGTSKIPVQATTNNFNLLRQGRFSWLLNGKAKFLVKGEAQIQIEEYSFRVPVNDFIEVDMKTLSGF